MILARTGFKLRGRQPEWIEQIEADELTHRRLLAVAPGGIGKSSVMGVLASRKWDRGIRTLITENREHLTEQTASRIRAETGLECDVEMADQRASPHAPVVVASVQSLGRTNRLTGFSPDHFGLVIPDECHMCLAPQPSRILSYFHWGAESLAEDWVKPADGLYVPRSTIVGFTASPILSGSRNLGEIFQRTSVNYPFLQSIDEGWLVGIVEENIPVPIDTRKFRRTKTAEGAGFNVADQNAEMIPIIKKLAQQIVDRAKNRKTICFLPSVECSRLMADALDSMGMNAIFVSGECLNKSDKIDAYNAAPRGTVLVNCAMVVYGVDFPDTDCIAPFSAVISKVNYVQKIYRGTRVLPGTLKEGMDADQRKAAIAASPKPHLLVLSPFFISDRIDLCEIFDLFGDRRGVGKKVTAPKDFTKPEEIRNYIKALEKAADKHQHRQPRTVDPVFLSVSPDRRPPEATNAQEAAPASKEELDFILAHDWSTVDIKTSGHAQQIIKIIRTRDQNGLCTAKQLQFLRKLGFPEEKAVLMKKTVAGAIIGKTVAGWR